jgi:lysophospholipase L1-like esterase
MKSKFFVLGLMAYSFAYASGNLLKNGNFEELDSNGNPVGWHRHTTSTWKVAKGKGVNGSNAMMFDCPSLQNNRGPVQKVKLEPGKKYIYRVKVRHEGLTGKIRNSGGVQMCLQGLDANGKRTCGYFSHGMQGTWNDWYEIKEFLMEVPVNTVDAEFSLSVWAGLTGKAWFDEAVLEEYVPPIVEQLVTSAYRDKPWEGTVRLAAALNIPTSDLKGYKGYFLYRDAMGKNVRVEANSMNSETAFFKIDASGFAMGMQTLKFELEKNGKIVGFAEKPFERLEKRPSEYKVWHDEHGRWIVRGRPFFPICTGVGKISPKRLESFLDYGLNTVGAGGQPSDETWDFCRTNKLKVIRSIGNVYFGERWTVKRGWKSYEDQYNFVTNRIYLAKDRPELLAWYLNDEPRPALRPKMVKQHELFTTYDPSRPTQSVFDHPEYVRGFLDTFDEYGLDPYPLGRWPVGQVADWAVGLKSGATGVKPFSVVVQAFDWMWFRMGKGMETPHFPTFGELRSMTWQAIVSGASGLRFYGPNYYDSDLAKKDYERNSSIFRRVVTEVRKFVPVFLSVEEPVKVTVPEKSKLLTRCWRIGNDSFVLVVNALGEGARAELKLSEKFERGFLEMGEGVEFAGGDTLTVEMEPLGCALVHLTDSKRHLILAGDSLLAPQMVKKAGRGSWGESLRPHMKDGIEIINTARGGKSTRTFQADDYWGEALAKTRPGDQVVISFGHNDCNSRTDRSVTVDAYRKNLAKFAKQVRAKGAKPIFVTSVATCTFKKDGSYNDYRGLVPYVNAMKQVGAELDVPVIDLYARTVAEVKALGKEKAAKYYWMSVDGKDNTHTTPAGAERYCGFFMEEVKANLPSLADWLK